MTAASPRSFAVVGAGVIGLAVARRLGQKFPDASVTVYEKEDRVARHQTGHNSGVVHAGLYYEPGSLKARLCRRGVALVREFGRDKGLPFVECGKLVVALDEIEHARLRRIFERAIGNGVLAAEMICPAGIREIEPNAVGMAALRSPTTTVVDYAGHRGGHGGRCRRGRGKARARAARLPRGIRAQAMSADGHLPDDVAIEPCGTVTHLRNAPAPGATSSLAIAEHIIDLITADGASHAQ